MVPASARRESLLALLGGDGTLTQRQQSLWYYQIRKGVRQGYMLSPCLFNLYAEYILQNAGLDESQAGIKIAKRNINNLRYVDDTTLITENEEEIQSLLMRVK